MIKILVKYSLYTLLLVTAILILSLLMYYKGMIYQCKELNYTIYTADNMKGFQCKLNDTHLQAKEGGTIDPLIVPPVIPN